MSKAVTVAGDPRQGSERAVRPQRIIAVVAATLLAMGMMVGPAAAFPEHGHALLLHAEWTGSGPSTEVQSFERCVDLANGRSLRHNAHHDSVHTGRAGEALGGAGHLVVPFASCADIHAAMG